MKKYTLLIVEDDNKLRTTMEDYFTEAGFEVLTASDGAVALKKFSENEDIINAILLDGMLPKVDGFDVLKQIRRKSEIPVIMVSARETEENQITGYRSGADGYITKPFLLSVLKEQVIALISRTIKEENLLMAGALSVNLDQRKVRLNGEAIETTPKEYDTLLYFMQNPKKVLDRNMILDAVWGIDYYGDFRTVDTIVKQLRKKLTNDYPYIKSVYGVGYYFEV